MDLGSIFLILALVILVAIFVSRPFYDRKLKNVKLLAGQQGLPENQGVNPEQVKHHSSLLAERERLLTALQELEFDYSLGKIPAEDYPEQRQYLLLSGAAVLRELDQIEDSNKVVSTEAAEARMEADVKRISLAGGSAGTLSAEQDELEALIAERRSKRTEKSSGFCPKCGKTIHASDEFCPHCGKKL